MEKNFTSIEDLKKIEEKYDPQLSFRTIGPKLSFIVTAILVSMSLYHFWASGFGLVREVLHRGIHISYVIGPSTSNLPAETGMSRALCQSVT